VIATCAAALLASSAAIACTADSECGFRALCIEGSCVAATQLPPPVAETQRMAAAPPTASGNTQADLVALGSVSSVSLSGSSFTVPGAAIYGALGVEVAPDVALQAFATWATGIAPGAMVHSAIGGPALRLRSGNMFVALAAGPSVLISGALGRTATAFGGGGLMNVALRFSGNGAAHLHLALTSIGTATMVTFGLGAGILSF
jgi:hypothetical protein